MDVYELMNRPIYNKLLRINSKERTTTNISSSDFTVSYPNVQVLQKVVSVILKHCSFPNVFYNITNTNNTFQYETTAGIVLITVPPGFYSLTALKVYMTPFLSGFEFNQNVETMKLTFSEIIPTAVQIKIYVSATSVLPTLLGFTSTVEATTLTAPNVPQLQGVSHVFIASRVLSKGNNFLDANKRQELPIFSMIPILVPYGSIQHYETSHEILDVVNFESEADLQNIDIKLFDGKGNALTLHGSEINIILKIYYRI